MADNQQPIIIKKGGGGHHDDHHGGAWKVAYADFVTAMMAFFLLLWLLNVTTEEQKKGIADYFTPASVSHNNSGGGGILGGQAMDTKQVKVGEMSGVLVKLQSVEPKPVSDSSEGEEREVGKEQTVSDADMKKQLAEREEQQFAAAERDLKQAIQSSPELKKLAESMIIDRTPEGLRIQVVDQDGLSMFAVGSSDLLPHTRNLMTQIGRVVQKLPNKIAVSGHTDARPYANDKGYSNWELSADRANASRRALLDSGLPAARISRVMGKAETEPLVGNEPLNPRNRRISIILLRENHTDVPSEPDVKADLGKPHAAAN
ncbi:MAG: flagellar motor protein MotB [Alphaproteobacteria bacterium]